MSAAEYSEKRARYLKIAEGLTTKQLTRLHLKYYNVDLLIEGVIAEELSYRTCDPVDR